MSVNLVSNEQRSDPFGDDSDAGVDDREDDDDSMAVGVSESVEYFKAKLGDDLTSLSVLLPLLGDGERFTGFSCGAI